MLQLGMLWDSETGCHTSSLAYRKPQSTSLKTPPKNIFTHVLLIVTPLLLSNKASLFPIGEERPGS